MQVKSIQLNLILFTITSQKLLLIELSKMQRSYDNILESFGLREAHSPYIINVCPMREF